MPCWPLGSCGHLGSLQCPKEQSLMPLQCVDSVRTKDTMLTETPRISSLNYNYKLNYNFKFCPTQQNNTRTRLILAEEKQANPS